MNLNCYKCYFSLVGVGLISLNTSLAANATESLKAPKQLANALEVYSQEIIYISKNSNNTDSKATQREYVYKAPDNKIIKNPQQLTQNQGYKVEVYGSADDLLQRVQDIEPRAFRKGQIIQVGIFSEQDNAEVLVRKLAVAGFWARIVSQ